MERRIIFEQPTSIDSLGRNGRMITTGTYVFAHPHAGGIPGYVLLQPISSRGMVGRCELVIDLESAADVGLTILDAFCANASPDIKAALLERMTAICTGRPDPGYAEPDETEEAPRLL